MRSAAPAPRRGRRRPARRAAPGRSPAASSPASMSPLQLGRAAAAEERRPTAGARSRRGRPAARAPRRRAARARAPPPARAPCPPAAIGTIGTTSAAPMRGCAPAWRRRSIRSRAHAIPASSAATSSLVARRRACTRTGCGLRPSGRRAAARAPTSASPIASIVARSRPSEKFGTASSGSTGRTLRSTADDRPQVHLPLARLARARPRPLPRLRRGRPPARVASRARAGRGQRAYLFGQAPGILEGDERRPWRGRAGQTLRRWLELDEDEFYATFYCASVTRCYPGRAASGRGDRTPTPRSRSSARSGASGSSRSSAAADRHGRRARARRLLGLAALTPAVGARIELDGTPVVPLPHPSGASGWLNDSAQPQRGSPPPPSSSARSSTGSLGERHGDEPARVEPSLSRSPASASTASSSASSA